MSQPALKNIFLNLLSAALRNVPADDSLFKGLDAEIWENIYWMSRKQSVSALIADKALTLPEDSLPPKEQNIEFITRIEQTKAMNRKMIQVLSNMISEYKEIGISFVLLKGLSNGVNYPQPLLRNPGDIDLFIYRKDEFQKSIDWTVANGIKTEIGDHIHYKFDKDGISIENHSRISYFDNKKYDRLFASWEKEVSEKENFTTVNIGGVAVKQLPVDMNAFFIFQHMFRHFVHFGVGFRQYCDWLLFLFKHRSEINADTFTETAKSYALLFPMQVFARAAIKYLNFSESIFPFEMINDDKYVDLVIDDIFNSGNFGFHKPGKQRPKEKMRGMWFSYKSTIKRSIVFGNLSPEHCKILPAQKMVNRIKIGF